MPNRPHFHHWFRLGYAARGLVFMGLGLLAWTSGRGAASGDVLERIRALPRDSALLGVMAVALRWLGRIGYATRAIVFFLIGWQLVRAGLAGHRIRDVAAVLDAIREHQWIFRLVSGGLFLFGVYSLVEAWYRRMPAEDELKARARASLA